MHDTHKEVTADRSRHAPARKSQPLAVGALPVRTERRTERHADVLVLWLSGALDKATSALLDREFDAQASHATHVVVDLTGLELIDSSGLETLVQPIDARPRTISGRPSDKDPMRDGSRFSSPTTPTCVPSRRLAART